MSSTREIVKKDKVYKEYETCKRCNGTGVYVPPIATGYGYAPCTAPKCDGGRVCLRTLTVVKD